MLVDDGCGTNAAQNRTGVDHLPASVPDALVDCPSPKEVNHLDTHIPRQDYYREFRLRYVALLVLPKSTPLKHPKVCPQNAV